MRILKDRTQSLCKTCFKQIPAIIFEDQGQVFIKKNCPEHGESDGLVEKDLNFYTSFAHINYQAGMGFYALMLPVTYKCNLNCRYCYTPAIEEDINLKEIKSIINNFSGKVIDLSGGEPTLREDLEEIIAFIKQAGKYSNLTTNGLRISDLKYLRSLKKSGLNAVSLSLDSFNEEFYNLMKRGNAFEGNILELKNNALANLEIEKMSTCLSATIYPGLNDKEIGDLFIFSLKRSHFISHLRLRSCVKIGRNTELNTNGYFASELLELFSGQTGIDKKMLIDRFLTSEYHTPHHVFFKLEGRLRKNKFFPFLHRKHNSLLSRYLIDLPKQSILRKLIKIIINRLAIKKMYVRIIRWPTIENVDIQEADRGVAYFCAKSENKILNFCHGIILENKTQDNLLNDG